MIETEKEIECEHLEYTIIGQIEVNQGSCIQIYDKCQCTKCNVIYQGDLIESIIK